MKMTAKNSARVTGLIFEIDNRLRNAANTIHRILHDAYVEEAALIEAEDFPPLRRTVADIMASDNQFLAYRRDGIVCAIIELEPLSDRGSDCTLIASLGVSPQAFRKGVGRALVKHALCRSECTVVVSTAERNKPAICLYEILGFSARRWSAAADGTPLVELRHRNE